MAFPGQDAVPEGVDVTQVLASVREVQQDIEVRHCCRIVHAEYLGLTCSAEIKIPTGSK